MSKRKAHTMVGGRPKKLMSMGANAPRLFLALDAETEAAMDALGQDCKGTVAAPDLAREAIRAYAASRCPGTVAQCLARVTKRREAEG